MDEQVWLYVGLAVIGLTGALFVATAARRGWTGPGLVVGGAHLCVVWLNAAAPVRGALDPGYAGYSFGFLHADAGIGVTLLSGTLLACALASALIAVRDRPGRRMLAVSLGGAPVLASGIRVASRAGRRRGRPQQEPAGLVPRGEAEHNGRRTP